MSLKPYEHITCQAKCWAIAELLRMEHYDAARHLWINIYPSGHTYSREYMIKAWVTNEDLDIIDKYQKFLDTGNIKDIFK